jgi:hypothetical protein
MNQADGSIEVKTTRKRAARCAAIGGAVKRDFDLAQERDAVGRGEVREPQ